MKLSQRFLMPIALLLLLVSAFLQIELASIGGLSVRLMYIVAPVVFSVVFVSVITTKPSIRLEASGEIYCYFGFLIVYGLALSAFLQELNVSSILLTLVGVLGSVSVLLITNRLGGCSVKNVLNWFAFLVLFLLALRFMMNLQFFQHFVSGNRAALTVYPFFVPGGWNIELTMLGFIALLTPSSRLRLCIIAYVAIFSVIFQSRSGAAISLLAIYWQFKDSPENGELSGPSKYRGSITLIVAIALLGLFVANLDGYAGLRERMLNLSQEISYANSGEGRLTIWKHALSVASDSPFGVGMGSSMAVLKSSRGLYYLSENNVHNIYMQALVDLGLLGFLVLALVAVRLTFRYMKGEYGLRLFVCYFGMGAFQFFLYDPAFWILAVMFYMAYKRPDAEATDLRVLTKLAKKHEAT